MIRKCCAAAAVLFLISTSAYALQSPGPPTAKELAKYKNARATISTRLGTIVVRFFPDVAPLHVKNFIYLAEQGFYNDTTFHRVIPGFMIQGGDPRGNGTGGPGYTIPAEFSSKKHVAGVLSMARMKNPDSAGSQFFIMVAPSPSLDGKYTVFGKVVEGQKVADKIASVPRDRRDKPKEPVKIKVTISY